MTVSQKLVKFADFQKGWSFGEGEQFSARVLQVAAFTAANAEFWPDVKQVDVFPGLEGNIRVVLYYFEGVDPNGESVDIDVTPDSGDGKHDS